MPTVNMPRLSDTMQEGTIGKWHKQPGDPVKKGESLAEIETDKATMDLEAFDEGVLEQVLVGEGQTVAVGQPVAVIGDGKGESERAPAAAAAPVGRSTANGSANGATNGARAATASAPDAPPVQTSETGDGREVHASPLARHMAAEHGIDLRELTGTGPGGRIVRDDIEDYLEAREQRQQAAMAQREPTAPAMPAATGGTGQVGQVPAREAEGERVELSRMQAAIARRLLEAKQTIPHFYVSNEVDVTELLALRETLNAAAGNGARVSVNDLIVKACALALEGFPEVNSSLSGTTLTRHRQINIGVAVDVPGGLVVPVIRDANVKGVRAIARETRALAEQARGGTLKQSDLEGGTFSVSNLGMMDVVTFVPIINPPQAAILGVGTARPHLVPVEGQPVVRQMLSLTVAADHRILYGAQVARFLQEVKRVLQEPYALVG
jgi:pyruvate dehydrogenase E2 component (dihydrolipoyllysine-residue acetyltransferase)